MAALQQQTNQLTQTGNRVVVEFGGLQVGVIRSCRISESYAVEAVYGIGDIDPVENVPTRGEYTVSVQGLVLNTGNLRSVGAIPENGDAAILGLVLDITFYSRDTNALLRKVSGCTYTSGDSDVTANAIIVQSSQWRGLRISGTGI